MSLNKVMLIGNLGKDPELKFYPSGTPYCNISIATSRKWTDKNTGELKEDTEWHRVQIAGRQAEVAKQYLKKGSGVYIEGRLQTRKWAGEDGIERYVTEVICESMQMLGSRNEANQSQAPQQNYQQPQQYAPQQQYSAPQQQPQQPNRYAQATGGNYRPQPQQPQQQSGNGGDIPF